jgi:glycosyltransferase involved in cell wall biosynthesis
MGIVNDISSRFPHKKVYWLPNGVDVQFYDPSNYEKHGFRSKNGFSDQDVLFFYGGILGHAQGLQTVLQAAKLVEINPNVQIILQGAGPEKEDLLKMKEELNLMNVHFLPPVPKQEMPNILKEVDVALVPLRKLELFLGAIPSKIFEALAMEKALLLGVGGEAKAHFIDKANAGCYYEPENSEDLSKKMLDLVANPEQIRQKGSNGRRYVTEHFNRNKIAADFIETLQNS